MGSYWIGWALNPMTGDLKRRKCGHEDMQGRRPCKDRCRGWSNVAAGQEMAKIASSHQKLGEKQGAGSPSEETYLANSLISNLQPPRG